MKESSQFVMLKTNGHNKKKRFIKTEINIKCFTNTSAYYPFFLTQSFLKEILQLYSYNLKLLENYKQIYM